jgi:hypothetical protein
VDHYQLGKEQTALEPIFSHSLCAGLCVQIYLSHDGGDVVEGGEQLGLGRGQARLVQGNTRAVLVARPVTRRGRGGDENEARFMHITRQPVVGRITTPLE